MTTNRHRVLKLIQPYENAFGNLQYDALMAGDRQTPAEYQMDIGKDEWEFQKSLEVEVIETAPGTLGQA